MERALQVELNDLTVRGRQIDGDDPVLLLISVRRENGSMLVEVWDRGDPLGARLVSASGPPAVWTRRVALAVSELGREQSRRRQVIAARARAEQARLQQERADLEAQKIREQPRLTASLGSLLLVDHAFLVGPALGLELNRSFPWRVTLGVGYQMGEVFSLAEARLGGGTPPWSAVVLGAGAERVFPLGDSLSLSLGVDARALLLHLSGAATLDKISGQRESYALLSGATSALLYRVNPRLAFLLRADVGPVLRGFSAELGDGQVMVRGAYAGLSISAALGAP